MVKKEGDLIFFESPGKILRFNCSSGMYDLIDSETGWTLISQATAGFNNRRLGDGAVTARATHGRIDVSSLFHDAGVRLDLTITLHARKMAYLFDMSLSNLSESTVKIEKISPFMLSSEGGGDMLLPRPTCYIQGYHSWDACQVLRVPFHRGAPQVSHWMTVMEDLTHSLALIMGFVTFTRALSQVIISPDGREIEAVTQWDSIPLQSDRTVNGERFMLTTASGGQEGLELWADVAAGENKTREMGATPSGWCSWYQAFHNIDENTVLANIERAGDLGGLDYLQVDDGYQASEGDWLMCNDKFPHGIKALAEAAHERGLSFGLWVAPFMVSRHSTIFKDHQAWLIKDRHGAPLPLLTWRSGEMYGLDCSHPDAQKWLEHIFSVMAEDWGVDMFKLDFLFLGAAKGARHKRSQTSAQAFRKGLEIIRQAVGKRFLLFCGAPLGPSIGIADGMRISGDSGPSWQGELSVSTAVKGSLLRSYMHRRLWLNDPDCLILRDKDTGLTLAEVQTQVTLVGLSGGIVAFSDALGELSSDRLSLFQKLVPSTGKSAVPSGIFTSGVPERFDLRLERSFSAWHVAALFNFSEVSRDITFLLSSLGMRKSDYLVYEFWSDTFLGILSESVTVKEVPAHGTALLCVRASLSHPCLLSSDFHLTQGAMEVGSCEWKRKEKVLHLTIRELPPREGKLIFYIPPGYVLDYVNCTSELFSYDQRETSLLEVRCRSGRPFQVFLAFA